MRTLDTGGAGRGLWWILPLLGGVAVCLWAGWLPVQAASGPRRARDPEWMPGGPSPTPGGPTATPTGPGTPPTITPSPTFPPFVTDTPAPTRTGTPPTSTPWPSITISPGPPPTPPSCVGWVEVASAPITPPPSPTGTPSLGYTAQLNAIAGGPGDLWAVGYAGHMVGTDGRCCYTPLIEHWDGTSWSLVPAPAGSGNDRLYGVAVVSATDAWAVGAAVAATDPTRRPLPLILHWDGVTWAAVAAPSPGFGNELRAVTVVGPNDVWAVGAAHPAGLTGSETLTMHWDGSAWSVVASPNPCCGNTIGLLGVDVVGPNDVWAVGTAYLPSLPAPLTLHWDGTAWTLVPCPADGPGSTLAAVTALAAADVWAVGQGGLVAGPYAVHWNGVAWTVASDPDVANGWFSGVSGSGPNDVWAVGYNYGPLVEHWDTGPWTVVPGTNVNQVNELRAVAALSLIDAWAVGISNAAGTRPLIEHYIPMPFTDVHFADYFYSGVGLLYCRGAVSGYADGTFRPYNNTTRGQMTKIIVGALGWPIDTSGGPHFSDVPPSNPFYSYIETAYHHGVVTGYADGTFRWPLDVTRAQLSKIIVLAAGWPIDTSNGPHFSDVPPTHPFYGVIETAYNRAVLTGYADGTFRPGANATRGQIAKMVYNAVTQP